MQTTNESILDALTCKGVLIDVSVKYWRATKKLKPEELGLDPDKVTKRLISLGHKKLLPRESLHAFALIESRTHAFVEACSFPFLNGVARYLPNSRLEETMAYLTEMESAFELARDEFLGNYTELRREAGNEWYAAARDLVDDPERLVATIRSSFPQPERMKRYFMFSTQLFQICVPESMDINPVTWENQREIVDAREKAVRMAREKIQSGVDGFVRDCVASLREQTARLCEEMLESIQTSKTGVHQKTLNRLSRFIDEVKSLNFAGDRELEEQLEEAKRNLLGRSADSYRTHFGARRSLEEGLREMADTAREMAKEDASEIVSQFGQFGHRRLFRVA